MSLEYGARNPGYYYIFSRNANVNSIFNLQHMLSSRGNRVRLI